MREIELNYFYCELYDRIYFNCNPSKIIARTEAAKIIGVAYNIPLTLRMYIIKEMESVGWIEKYNRFNIRLVRDPFNIKDNPSLMGKGLGIW